MSQYCNIKIQHFYTAIQHWGPNVGYLILGYPPPSTPRSIQPCPLQRVPKSKAESECTYIRNYFTIKAKLGKQLTLNVKQDQMENKNHKTTNKIPIEKVRKENLRKILILFKTMRVFCRYCFDLNPMIINQFNSIFGYPILRVTWISHIVDEW